MQKRTRIMKGEVEKGKYCLSCDVLDFFRNLEGMLCRWFDDIDEMNFRNGTYEKDNFNSSELNEL